MSDNLDIRVINAVTGELLRQFTLDPARNYQPIGTENHKRPEPEGSRRPECLATSRWWRGQDLNLRPSGYEHSDQPLSPYHCVPDRALTLEIRRSS